MSMKHSELAKLAGLAIIILATFASLAVAQQTVPFAVVGSGVGPTGLPLPGQPARMHWAVGVASQLGLYYGEGSVRTDSATFNPDGTITGEFGSGDPFVFRGLSGKLATYYGRTDQGAANPGTFTLAVVGIAPSGNPIVEAEWIAEFVVQGGQSTGRFRNASGSWVMYAYSAPFELGSSDPVHYWWYGAGLITLRR